jgi:flagellar capping protein FliD
MAGYLGVSGSTSGDSSTTGLASLNSTYFNQLINLQLQQAQTPITQLQSDKSTLGVKRGVFVDTKISLTSLNSAALELKDTSSSVFTTKAISSTDATAVTASGGNSAVSGSYAISVATLAKAHRVRSDVQASADQSLGLSGSFVIGGSADRAVSGAVTVANTVTGFSTTSSLRSGQTELGSGSYSVEVQSNAGTYQFRVVDAEGKAMSIAKAGESGTAMTANWQDLSLVSGSTFDTGRGLAISFGSEPYTAGSRGAGAASVTYAAQGVSIGVASSTTLTQLRDLINRATYAEGNEVRASILDRALVLESAATGARHVLAAGDVQGSVLQSLGVLSGSSFKTTLQQAADAAFSVNGLNVQRSKNTGLDDVIQGVTLGLLEEDTDATLTVKPDATAIGSKITEVLQKLNSTLDYLKDKTAVTKDETTNTYTRGGLVGETVFQGLRQGLITVMRGKIAGAASTAMDELADLGIGLDSSLHLAVTDSAKLQSAIENNLDGVVAVLDDRMSALTAKLTPFIKSTTGALDSRINAMDTRTKQIDTRVSRIQTRVKVMEDGLVARYGKILMQLPNYNQDLAISNYLYSKSTAA